MFVLGHLVFELIKIAILSFLYATLIYFILYIAGKIRPNLVFLKTFKAKFFFGLSSWVIISVSFFFFMFTYWGNHGLGDSARVPIGNGKDVKQIDGSSTYIEYSNLQEQGIQNFAFDDKNLYAELDNKWGNNDSTYIIWNLKTDTWKLYKTKDDYLKVAQANNYPSPETFFSFDDYYTKYWGTWRFWMLP